MQEKDLNNLLAKLRAGSIQPEEELMLKYWLHQLNSDGDTGISDQELQDISLQMWTHIQAHKSSKTVAGMTAKRPKKLWVPIAAAVVLTVISISLHQYQQNKNRIKPLNTENIFLASNRQPDYASLTLSDGSVINLNDTRTGALAEQAGVKILKTAAGEVTYVVQSKALGSTAELTYNTIRTPKGMQYSIKLPDGSKVWLNSLSSLKYPSRFVGKERSVSLTGEAYFEIAKHETQSFIVLTAGQQVTVLGTHFNVNSYPEEPFTITTLLEGSVNVSESLNMHAEQRSSIRLVPNQQSILNHKTKDFKIGTIDPILALAWRDGYFHFDNLDIASIMRTISRWYQVEVAYKGQMPSSKFSGRISRTKDITEVLELLASTGAIHYQIEPIQTTTKERRIVISK